MPLARRHTLPKQAILFLSNLLTFIICSRYYRYSRTYGLSTDMSELSYEHYTRHAELAANKAERDSLKYLDAKRIARMEDEASGEVDLPDLDIL